MPITTAATSGPSDMHLRRGSEVMNVVSTKPPAKASRMVRLTVNLPSHLVEQMRDAVYWTPGLTLAWMIARAVRASLTELETVHQGPFPKRLKPLRAGRPRLLGQAMKVPAPLASEGANGTAPLLMRPTPQRALEAEENARLNTPRMPK